MSISIGLPAWAQRADQTPPPLPAPAADPRPSDRLPVSAFYDDAAFGDARLSPDGANIAYVEKVEGGFAVAVKNMKTGDARIALHVSLKGMTIEWVRWKDDNRLLIGVRLEDIIRAGGNPDGEIKNGKFGQFIVAVNRDGTNMVQLLKGDFWNTVRGANVKLLDRLKNDPDHILAVAPDESQNMSVWKVNIRTGEAALVERSYGDVISWGTDITGAVVSRYREANYAVVIETRGPGQTVWTKAAVLKPKDLKVFDDFEFLGATDKPSQLYVAVEPKNPGEGDTRRLRIYDTATKTLSEPIWPARPYDVDSIITDLDSGKLLAVCYDVDTYTCEFTDPALQSNYKGLVNYFKSDRSVMAEQVIGDDTWLLRVSGPSEPDGYYIYSQSRHTIGLLGERFPDLTTTKLGSMRRYSYTARDGFALSGYLTRPPNAPDGPLPLVVMPHGGPKARDSFEYDPWSQIIATRGYLVLQPNFRGSGGFGLKFEQMGYHQWGGVMADDITDAVQALIKSGQVDPHRICIFGASYGGFAALYAGATHPELYKCVVSWAGVSDLHLALRRELRLAGKEAEEGESYKYWTKAIGDMDKDKVEIKAASPITYAATYKPPVLLLHSEADYVVAAEQSKLMDAALKREGKDVRLILLHTEGHPYWSKENELPAMTEVVNFIEAHIAPAVPAASPSATPAPAQP